MSRIEKRVALVLIALLLITGTLAAKERKEYKTNPHTITVFEVVETRYDGSTITYHTKYAPKRGIFGQHALQEIIDLNTGLKVFISGTYTIKRVDYEVIPNK